jgi:hypothetical protein
VITATTTAAITHCAGKRVMSDKKNISGSGIPQSRAEIFVIFFHGFDLYFPF